MTLILKEMSEGSKLHLSPTFQKLTLREGGRERGGGGWVQIFKTNTVERADTYCTYHHDMKQKIINIIFQMHQRAKCSETGRGWEAEWGEYALRNAQIQMGVSKTCGWGWGLFERKLFQG